MISASNVAATSQVAPIASAEKPSTSSRSGPSTFSVPNRNAGRTTNQIDAATLGSTAASNRRRSGCGVSGRNAGVRHAQTARTDARTATLANAGPVPTIDATPPSTGPNSAPTIAAPMAAPIVSPRRSGGAAATSQASPAVHENELAKPWKKRARSSTTIDSANPNTVVVTAMPSSPTSTVGRTPNLAADRPPGIPPASAPSAYAAESSPAPAFERSRSSAYWGSSGVSAA